MEKAAWDICSVLMHGQRAQHTAGRACAWMTAPSTQVLTCSGLCERILSLTGLQEPWTLSTLADVSSQEPQGVEWPASCPSRIACLAQFFRAQHLLAAARDERPYRYAGHAAGGGPGPLMRCRDQHRAHRDLCSGPKVGEWKLVLALGKRGTAANTED